MRSTARGSRATCWTWGAAWACPRAGWQRSGHRPRSRAWTSPHTSSRSQSSESGSRAAVAGARAWVRRGAGLLRAAWSHPHPRPSACPPTPTPRHTQHEAAHPLPARQHRGQRAGAGVSGPCVHSVCVPRVPSRGHRQHREWVCEWVGGFAGGGGWRWVGGCRGGQRGSAAPTSKPAPPRRPPPAAARVPQVAAPGGRADGGGQQPSQQGHPGACGCEAGGWASLEGRARGATGALSTRSPPARPLPTPLPRPPTHRTCPPCSSR